MREERKGELDGKGREGEKENGVVFNYYSWTTILIFIFKDKAIHFIFILVFEVFYSKIFKTFTL